MGGPWIARMIRHGLTTHSFLNCRIDEDTGDDGILRSGADKSRAFICPHFLINGGAIFCNHVNATLNSSSSGDSS